MAATLTLRDIAKQLGLSERTVLRWIDSGHLTATDISAGDSYSRWRVDPKDLDLFLASRRNVRPDGDAA